MLLFEQSGGSLIRGCFPSSLARLNYTEEIRMRYRDAVDKKLSLAILPLCLGIILVAGFSCGAQERAKPEGTQPKAQSVPQDPTGYTDTPFLPGGKWRVHDISRPHPRIVTPGTASTADRSSRPPSDAVVLFDGKDLSAWSEQGTGKDAGKTVPARWKVENGYMEVTPGTGSIISKEKFGDCQIHVEWAAPKQVQRSSQGRGNSGVLIMSRYEIQVLDSFQNVTYADGQASAIYGQWPPLVDASLPPGEWQTYDIVFEAPRFEGDKLVKPAYVTIFHNGVLVHNHKELMGPVRHRQLTQYAPHPAEEPLLLQNHTNPVRYRSVWVRRIGGYDEP